MEIGISVDKIYSIENFLEKKLIMVDFNEGCEITKKDVLSVIGETTQVESYSRANLIWNMYHCTIEDEFLNRDLIEDIIDMLEALPQFTEEKKQTKTALVANERVTRELSELFAILSEGRLNNVRAFEKLKEAMNWIGGVEI